jgi:hypothetical protein
VQASVAQRAVAAARSTASTFDLPVDATVVLNDSNRLVVRLMPCDVVARVTPPEALAPVYYSCRFTVSARPYVFRDGHAAACGYVSGCWGWRLD